VITASLTLPEPSGLDWNVPHAASLQWIGLFWVDSERAVVIGQSIEKIKLP
jgi:hypothetical protein